MAGLTPASLAARRLLEMKDSLALEITDSLYERMPGLLDKYGEYGREKCLQDMRYNLEHLAPAVDLGRPDMFAGYIRWLDDLLRARGVSTSEVVLSLELSEERIRARFPADEAEAILPSLRAALAELPPKRDVE